MATTFLVIGATGTPGAATVDALLASGVEHVAFVRDAQRATEQLDPAALKPRHLPDSSTRATSRF
jgi:uncharacterized protein YbjT (DUF2867 family)